MSTAKQLTSLIALFREPRAMNLSVVWQMVESAFGTKVGDQWAYQVRQIPEKPLYAVQTPDSVLGVVDARAPYFKDIAYAADHTRDFAAKQAIQQHTAWISVDLMRGMEGQKEDAIYAPLGKLLAQFLNADVLALMRSPTGQISPFDSDVPELLTSGKAMEVFTRPPPDKVIEAKPGDEELAAAAKEAQRRWPEFLEAFSKKSPRHGFGVKKAFSTQGSVEHMWVEVQEIDGENLRGKLASTPKSIRALKLGDPVSLTAAEVEDWIFTRGRESVGGFQAQVLKRRQ